MVYAWGRCDYCGADPAQIDWGVMPDEDGPRWAGLCLPCRNEFELDDDGIDYELDDDYQDEEYAR